MQTHPISIQVPSLIMQKVRDLANKRKAQKHPVRTQKDIIIEIMQNGLLVTDEAPAVMAEGELNVLPL